MDESDFVSAGGVTIRDIFDFGGSLLHQRRPQHTHPLNIISVGLLIMMV